MELHKKQSWIVGTRAAAITALLVVLSCGMARPAAQAADATANDLKSIEVTFKFDPGPTYGGPQWHPAPFTSPVQGGQAAVEAKVQGVDLEGKLVAVSPQWTAQDPGMVVVSAISPGSFDHVRITVTRAGESKLKVLAQQVSTELLVSAKSLLNGKALQVQISIANVTAPASAARHDVVPPDSGPGGVGLFTSKREQQSYALGMNLAETLRNQAIEVDQNALAQGYKDAISGKTAITEQEARAILAVLREEMRTSRESQLAGGKDVAAANKKAGEAFLAANKTKEGVVALPSGLQYKILKAGDGRKPGLDDVVVCNYRGTYLNGSEFDSSYKRGKPAMFALKGVIPGWREALQLMPVGSRWQLFIPSELAYGERGSQVRHRQRGVTWKQQGIAPNATLIFEVELLSVENNSDAGQQRAQHDAGASANDSSRERNQ